MLFDSEKSVLIEWKSVAMDVAAGHRIASQFGECTL